MIKEIVRRKSVLLKWLLVILSLLFIPQSGIAIVFVFSFLYVINKLDNLDVILAFFLIYFVQNGITGMGSMVMLRYLLIPVVVLKSVLMIRQKKQKNKYTFLYIFLAYLLFNVTFISLNSSFSLLEYVFFLVMLLFGHKGTYAIGPADYNNKIINIESLYFIILISSLLVFPLKEISYARNGIGFQGISVHPNAFGVFIAPFCSYLFLKVFNKKNYYDIFLLLIACSLLFLSKSRTSMFSFLLAISIYFIVNSKFRSRFSKAMIFLSAPLLLFISLNFTVVISGINSFLIKNDGAASFSESVEQSRGGLFESQIINIEENPLFGIGFKMPSNKIAVTKTSAEDEVFYEKGNMLMASLEEIGIIGTLLFLCFLISTLKIRASGDFVILPFTALITTLGEATLFSIGGLGLLIWVLVFLNRYNKESILMVKKKYNKI